MRPIRNMDRAQLEADASGIASPSGSPDPRAVGRAKAEILCLDREYAEKQECLRREFERELETIRTEREKDRQRFDDELAQRQMEHASKLANEQLDTA